MTIYVLNPNSTVAVTDGISKAVDAQRALGFDIECLTSHDGPSGIESDADVDAAANRLPKQMEELEGADAVVVACFSDPGVSEAAHQHHYPVVGIRQAAVATALRLGKRFGVIAMGEASIPRHIAAFAELDVLGHVAGDRSVGLSMLDLQDRSLALPRLMHVAKQLRELDKADVLILGCAGMPGYKNEIECAIGLPIVEPCSAGVALAIEQFTSQPNRPARPSHVG